MNCYQVRTDLALEARECAKESDEEIRGVRLEEDYDEEIEVKTTRVIIETKNGAKAVGKPMGTYITLEAPRLADPDEDYHREISEKLAEQIKCILPQTDSALSVLVVGLGNREVTADALGPESVDNLLITRHMVKEFGIAAYHRTTNLISAIVPGVMAQTGMESLEIIKGIVQESKPDAILVIDALAARSVKRLNRTIQVTNTGIHPGSGVGNHRSAITMENLLVPVIAIGIPMVVDAATIVGDALQDMARKEGIQIPVESMNNRIMTELNNMYVTGKDIDATVKRLSFTISEALNMALKHPDQEETECCGKA
ncbi:MAG: GPR endopeptidase [Lachnospiraceae bacterium]|nr:GPR endopeptidase [Lachnospiraceae bacterium]